MLKLNMMKRLLSTLCVMVLLLSFPLSSAHAGPVGWNPTVSAESLYTLGLFKGVGVNEDGSPNFNLNATVTRQEATITLIRLVGKEQVALNGTWRHPFSDVDTWADKYVGYAYENGIVYGVSETQFGANEEITYNQYCTLLLRALGYNTETDFEWSNASAYALSIGLHSYGNGDKAPNRGSLASTSFWALTLLDKDKTSSLLVDLYKDNIITRAQIDEVGLSCFLNFGLLSNRTYESCPAVPDYGKIFGVEISEMLKNGFGYRYEYERSKHSVEYWGILTANGFEDVTEEYPSFYYVDDETFELTEDSSRVYYNEETKDTVYLTDLFTKGEMYCVIVKINAPITREDYDTMRGFTPYDGAHIHNAYGIKNVTNY